MAAINPDYGKRLGTVMNCVLCSAAYELRRRGYDVEANESQTGRTLKHIDKMFDIRKALAKDPTVFQAEKTKEELEKALKDNMPDGARGLVCLEYGEEHFGHCVAWEKEKGNLIIRDCQDNTTTTFADKDICSKAETDSYYFALRTDTLEINTANITDAVKPRRSTKLAHSDDILEHHGILGQKWGVRRYQNVDGTRTAAGKKRYGGSQSASMLSIEEKKQAVSQLSESLNKEWDYGVLQNGKHELDMSKIDWNKDYRTLPVETLQKEKIGTCWDFVNYQHSRLKELGIDDKSYMIFIQRSSDPKDAVTHTFTTFELDGKQYWLESAAWPKRGLHEISGWQDVARELNDMYKNDRHGYSIFQYNPDGMDKGLSPDEFVDIVTQDNNYVYDEPAKNSSKRRKHA